MEFTVARFESFAEAEKAERDFYLRLTPEERLKILLDLVAMGREAQDAAGERLARVYRIVELAGS